MLKRFLAAVTVLTFGLPLVSVAAPQGRGSAPSFQVEPLVEIDGAKTPALIPDHVLWREGFRTLREAAKNKIDAILLSLHVQEPDRTDVFDEAEYQGALEDRSYARQNRSKALILPPGVAFDKIPLETLQAAQSATKAVILEHRRQIIDGRDRLLSVISPQSAEALTQWMESRRRGIKLLVPESDLESGWYRLPK